MKEEMFLVKGRVSNQGSISRLKFHAHTKRQQKLIISDHLLSTLDCVILSLQHNNPFYKSENEGSETLSNLPKVHDFR